MEKATPIVVQQCVSKRERCQRNVKGKFTPFTVIWINWWVCKLVAFLHDLVSFHTEKNTSELQANQNLPLQTTWECLVRSLARCVWGESDKGKYRNKVLGSALLENTENSFHGKLLACTDLCTILHIVPYCIPEYKHTWTFFRVHTIHEPLCSSSRTGPTHLKCIIAVVYWSAP